MRQSFRCWVLALGLASFTSIGHADMCDDIDSLADWWDQYTVWLEGLEESGFTQEQADQADVRLAEGIAPTRAWADFLIAQGADVPFSLGTLLNKALADLEASQDADELFGALYDVVDTLDKAVEVCDANAAAAAEPVEAPPATGSIPISYEPAPQSPGYPELAAALKESGVYEAIAGTVSSAVALPVDLPVVFAACGQVNAFYDPNAGRVVMCYELFGQFASSFVASYSDEEQLGNAILGAGAFVFLHELGHALVDLFDVPITGREEDSVDSLATLILIHGDGEAALFSAIESMGAMADLAEEGSGGELAFWNEHSLWAQRLYDVACLVYGSDPQAYAPMVGPDALPEERAVRCPAEFEQKDRAWDVLLEPYFRE